MLLACLVAGTGAAFALRHNYATMTELRSAVYEADKTNTDVVGALQRLRSYVGNHMNTSLATADGVYPPIQLKYTYERLQQAERERADAANSRIYTDAQAQCEALHPGSFSGRTRVPCIEQYVKEHGSTVRAIPDAMYKFNFASPRWSPDLAGWLVVLTGALAAAGALRFVLGLVLKQLLG